MNHQNAQTLQCLCSNMLQRAGTKAVRMYVCVLCIIISIGCTYSAVVCVFNYCTNFDSCLDCSISAGKGHSKKLS